MVRSFLAHLYYYEADFNDELALKRLGVQLEFQEAKNAATGRLFYLATAPEYFGPLVALLTKTGLLPREGTGPWGRVVVEKPFGKDLTSALKLDTELLSHLAPSQLYRIDHYLGKDTVQNLLATRFGNAVFEPLFRREHVDHVQITAAETVGMEDRRGTFYDKVGALRDVVENHLLQLLALVAMEPPETLTARDIKKAKVQVLRNLVPIAQKDVFSKSIRAQYTHGIVQDLAVSGYREESGVSPTSTTETYVALRAEIDNQRWAGVPFLLRTGKHLARRVTEVAIHFRQPSFRLFRTVECEGDYCDLSEAAPNVLVFRIQPAESITLDFSVKRPGMSLDLNRAKMHFDYSASLHRPLPEAYERLIFDALRGDQTLFIRSDELETAWNYVTPILQAWRQEPSTGLETYPAGTWGPAGANRLTQGCDGGWRRP